MKNNIMAEVQKKINEQQKFHIGDRFSLKEAWCESGPVVYTVKDITTATKKCPTGAVTFQVEYYNEAQDRNIKKTYTNIPISVNHVDGEYCRIIDSKGFFVALITAENKDKEEEQEYTPSSTAGDYGPSNPWDAPGMSIHDFI